MDPDQIGNQEQHVTLLSNHCLYEEDWLSFKSRVNIISDDNIVNTADAASTHSTFLDPIPQNQVSGIVSVYF